MNHQRDMASRLEGWIIGPNLEVSMAKGASRVLLLFSALIAVAILVIVSLAFVFEHVGWWAGLSIVLYAAYRWVRWTLS